MFCKASIPNTDKSSQNVCVLDDDLLWSQRKPSNLANSGFPETENFAGWQIIVGGHNSGIPEERLEARAGYSEPCMLSQRVITVADDIQLENAPGCAITLAKDTPLASLKESYWLELPGSQGFHLDSEILESRHLSDHSGT